jgi:very-short-patch-repair endonuclease
MTLTARELRRCMTPAESFLWEKLRKKALGGMKFNRQHPIRVELEGRDVFVVVDFFCHARRLVVEVDGPVHNNQKEEDAIRTRALAQLGLRVIRFSNAEVLHNPEYVLRTILDEAESR